MSTKHKRITPTHSTKNKAPSKKESSPVNKKIATSKSTSSRVGQAAVDKVYTKKIDTRSGSGLSSTSGSRSGQSKPIVHTQPARSGTDTGTGIKPASSGSGSTEVRGGGIQIEKEVGQHIEGVLEKKDSISKSLLGKELEPRIDSSCNDDETGEDNEVLQPTLDSAIEVHQPDIEDAQEIAKTARLELDRQIIELRTKGFSYTQIQHELKINRKVIARCLKRFIKDTRNQLGMKNVTHAEMQGKIFNYAPEALETIVKLSRKAKKEDVRMKASADIMDRAGFTPVQKTINLHAVEQMSREELKGGFAALIQRVKERNTSQSIVDIKPSDGESNLGGL